VQVWGAGEDTALAPLLPDLLAVLQGGGEIEAARIAAVGGRYIKEMRERLPPERAGARWFVDKMLRNAWWVVRCFGGALLRCVCLLNCRRAATPALHALSTLEPQSTRAMLAWPQPVRCCRNLGFIAMMLSDACIIHAARHPADTGLSCYAQPFEGRGTPWASNLTSE
jgi:hypothetical protein